MAILPNIIDTDDRGIVVLKNKNRFTVFKLHYTADDDKDLAWASQIKPTYPSLDIWNQEMELDFTKSTGLRIYPEFKEHLHVREDLRATPLRHIARCWDFGYRHPAVVFMQMSPDDQLIILDEMFGSDVVISEFAKSVRRFTKANYPGFEIEDYCDPAGKFKSDKSKMTSIDILHTQGIYPRYRASLIHDGINLIRTLLLLREDKEPGLLINRRCTILCDAFMGGYTRDEITEEPVKDGYYEHPMDALRYGVVNMYSVRTFEPLKPAHPFVKKRKTADKVSGY